MDEELLTPAQKKRLERLWLFDVAASGSPEERASAREKLQKDHDLTPQQVWSQIQGPYTTGRFEDILYEVAQVKAVAASAEAQAKQCAEQVASLVLPVPTDYTDAIACVDGKITALAEQVRIAMEPKPVPEPPWKKSIWFRIYQFFNGEK